MSDTPCWFGESRPLMVLARLYGGCWRPIKVGRLCRVTRLFKGQPIVECLGPLTGPANLRGDQYWRVRFSDGTEREVARAHLSLKLLVEHSFAPSRLRVRHQQFSNPQIPTSQLP